MKKYETIEEVIKEHSDRLRCYYCGSDIERISHVINSYHDDASGALEQIKSFRDDLLTYLRAIALVVDMAANASTHREKNARLRGMVELLESAIDKLRKASFEFTLNHRWASYDIFRSDYPTRHLVDRIHELEDELRETKEAISNENIRSN